jgi:SAM-dependent methyltransferase
VTYYGRRLAAIHAADYTAYATAAAGLLVGELAGRTGTVVDLGCGAGDLAPAVTAAGFDYLGVDTSADMLALARSRHPHASFEEGSAFDHPRTGPVTAVVAVGEVLNYAADPRAGLTGLVPWLHRCRSMLAPGGVLLLDLAGPLRADPEPMTRVVHGEGYRLEVTTVTNAARTVLTRTITLTDAEGSLTEVHELALADPIEVMAAMRGAGFEVTALSGYADGPPFARGWSGFLARVILES